MCVCVCVYVYFCSSVGLCDVMPIKHGDDLGLYSTLKNTEAVLDVIKDIGRDIEPPGSKLYVTVSWSERRMESWYEDTT